MARPLAIALLLVGCLALAAVANAQADESVSMAGVSGVKAAAKPLGLL
jgi:hypothetical protein